VFGQPLDTPTLPSATNFNGLLFGWTLRMYIVQAKVECVALPFPEIIRRM